MGGGGRKEIKKITKWVTGFGEKGIASIGKGKERARDLRQKVKTTHPKQNLRPKGVTHEEAAKKEQPLNH